MLTRETFKKRAQFLTAQHKGQSTAVSGIVLQAIPKDIMDKAYKNGAKHNKNPLRNNRGGFVDSNTTPPPVRIGFTATKKVGNAVARNRAKRRLRALADTVLIPNGRPDYDYVLIARESTVNRPWQNLQNDVIKALKKLNVYQPK